MLNPKRKSSKGMLPILKPKKNLGLYLTIPLPVRKPLTKNLNKKIISINNQNIDFFNISVFSILSKIKVKIKETEAKMVYSFILNYEICILMLPK